MNRVEKKFMELKAAKEKGFIVYITAGDPDIETTVEIARELVKSNVDLIEFGIPFSDPLADGPTIQEASQRALRRGITIKAILKAIASLRSGTDVPFVFMTYYNPILKYGVKSFIKDAKESGVDGVIVPDLPIEESGELIDIAEAEDFSLILLAAPTSTDDRLKAIAKRSKGFIYYVSLTGVTGARKDMAADLANNVKRIKRFTNKPVCVGFGVSTPDQAREVAEVADGVIVGSAIIKVIEKNIGRDDLVKRVGNFTRTLVKGIKSK